MRRYYNPHKIDNLLGLSLCEVTAEAAIEGLPSRDNARPRAVTSANSNSYGYDDNGNQTHRLVHSIVNEQLVTQEFEMEYDAENRVVSVTGVEGTTYSAHFDYDGNGQRV